MPGLPYSFVKASPWNSVDRPGGRLELLVRLALMIRSLPSRSTSSGVPNEPAEAGPLEGGLTVWAGLSGGGMPRAGWRVEPDRAAPGDPWFGLPAVNGPVEWPPLPQPSGACARRSGGSQASLEQKAKVFEFPHNE